MEKSTRISKKRIRTLAIVLLLVGFVAFLTATALSTRAPAYADGGTDTSTETGAETDTETGTDTETESDPKVAYAFTVDTGSYASGSVLRVKDGNYPTFTLAFRGTVKTYSTMSFWYGVSDTNDISGVSGWVKIGNYDENTGTGTVPLTALTDEGGIIHKYLFFRGGSSLALTESQWDTASYYEYPQFVEVHFDKNTDDNVYKIDSLSASYTNGSAVSAYDLSASSPTWISSPLTVSVTNNGGVAENAKFYYKLEGYDAVPFTVNKIGDRYVGEAQIPSEEIPSYQGKIEIYSTDLAGGVKCVYGDGATLSLRYDAVSPKFEVTATVPKGSGIADYVDKSWASTDITYKIVPTATVSSGATYKYYSDNETVADAKELNSEGGGYVLTISESQKITFISESGSGLSYSSQRYEAYIDKNAPELKIEAKDGVGASVSSLGDESAAVGSKKGYASNSITFTLSNATEGQNEKNTPTYFFSEKEPSDGEYGQTVTSSNGNYTITLTGGEIIKKSYYFTVKLASGLVSTKSFTVTVLDSNFDVAMDVTLPARNSEGWYKDPVSVTFTMDDVFVGYSELQTNDAYRIYRYVTTDKERSKTYDNKDVEYEYDAENGKVKCTVLIDDLSLNDESVSFEVRDRANNVVTKAKKIIDNEEQLVEMVTGNLKLDLVDPSGYVTATIKDSTITLREDDWSSQEVLITIDTVTGADGELFAECISDVNCYRMLSETTASSYAMTRGTDGRYTLVVDESGRYGFRLESGAGRTKDIWYTVNIDTSKITLNGISLETYPDGETIGSIEEKDANDNKVLATEKSIANDVRVRFDSNQNGHFVLLVAEYNGSMPESSAYTEYEPDDNSYIVELPEEGGSGTLTYVFILRSTARNKDGDSSVTATYIVKISYDVEPFNITASYGSEGKWVGTTVNITLGLDAGSYPQDGKQVVAKYQYKLDGDTAWRDVETSVTSLDGGVTFAFEGVKNVVSRDKDKKGNLIFSSSDGGTYMSYDGDILFRALNAAGYPSNELKVSVKVDTSTPSPFYGVAQTSGEMIYDSDFGVYTIYSKDKVYYASASLPQKAPITYYYRASNASDNDTSISGKNWETPTSSGAALSAGRYYMLYAKNSVGRTSKVVKVFIFEDSSALTAEITSAGTRDSHGIWTSSWKSEAEVYFQIKSGTAVYIMYKSGNGDWQAINETALNVQNGVLNNHKITFSGEGDDDKEQFIIAGDRNETVKFKVINLSGREVEVESAVRIKIDTSSPEFEFEIKTSSVDGNLTVDDLAANWYPDAVIVRMKPSNINPSGVTYKYRIDGTTEYEQMRGDFFSTDDIVSFGNDHNGEITIYVRAMTNANSDNVVEKPIKFKIDKVVPDFELTGRKGTSDGTSTKTDTATIKSREWTNATLVSISLTKQAASQSKVEYTYWILDKESDDEPSSVTVWNPSSPIEIKETNGKVLYVRARNESGLTVTRKFAVNIDNVAPTIHAGKITNGEDGKPNSYYIDQKITFTEDNLKSATYNDYPLANGQVIATNNVDNSNNGLVHIVVEDLAGNKAELTFYMKVFDLTVNNITLSDDHRAQLQKFEDDYEDAKADLDDSRSQYFSTYIGRLKDRIAVLEKQINDYQGYLEIVNSTVTFDLVSDYPKMETYMSYFNSEDDLVRYPDWQQEAICNGIYEDYYQKLETQFNKLNDLMKVVRAVQKEVVALPATNVVESSDYQDVIRVYNKYVSLTVDQKAVFKSALYNKLVELKRLCEVKLLQSSDTGVKIEGDSLVGETAGFWLNVTAISSTSEKFKQAQSNLYSTYGSGEPTKIISIHQLTLEGNGSQYDTGEITITLPIPSDGEVDYASNYVYFGVYKLTSDGSIVPIKTSRLAPDGNSIFFTCNELGTFILATAGNVVPRAADTKIYGSIAGVEIDGALLTYITFAVIGMFVVFVVIMILIAVRRNRFLRAYNRDHKRSLVRRGITRIPKGNPPPASNPARPEERVGHEGAVYYRKK